jgi:hypothetical protein
MLKSYRWTSELGSRSHCVAFLSQIESSGTKTLYFEKEGDLNRSATAKPTASAGLKNWLFWFDLIRYMASTGRATPETHHQARLAQTDSAQAQAQGGSTQFPGVLVWRWVPPRSFASTIKCHHQKSTVNSAGSSVGALAPPQATPRLGGAAVSCQYFPCSFVLAPRAPSLRLGVKAPLPLRASSRGVLPGAGALAGYRTPIPAGLSFVAH